MVQLSRHSKPNYKGRHLLISHTLTFTAGMIICSLLNKQDCGNLYFKEIANKSTNNVQSPPHASKSASESASALRSEAKDPAMGSEPDYNPTGTDAQLCKHVHQHNITSLKPVMQCNETMMSAIRHHIPHIGALGPLTGCFENTWIETFFQNNADIGSDYPFVGISVGCNKGHDAIRTARMGMSTSAFNEADWRHALVSANDGKEMIYNCRMDGNRSEFKVNPNSSERKGEMHCIEPMPANYALLEKASRLLDLEKKNFFVANAAVASANGIIPFPNGGGPGDETNSIDGCWNWDGCQKVPLYTLDSYVANFVRSKGPIHVLQIDTEGWDFDVLFGAGAALDRTYYLEFELHDRGTWKSLHVTDAVRLLDSKGFTCYWPGTGKLLRITECYFDDYTDWHTWSNVVCVHRSHVVLHRAMENLFLETIGT